jgi:dienelactone hydrolase
MTALVAVVAIAIGTLLLGECQLASADEGQFRFPSTGVSVEDHAVLLAVDDVSLPLKRNLAYFITKPDVRPEPILSPSRDNRDAPDYLATHFYGTVLHDEDRFRMWYYPCHLGRNPDWPAELQAQADRWEIAIVPGPLCYAESDDGIHWTKPNLGQLLFKGSRDNNAIDLPSALTANATIIKDESDPDPQRRYKLVFWSQYDPYDYPTMRLATSPDGIQWTTVPGAPLEAFLEHASFYQFGGKYIVNAQTFLPGESGRNRGRQGAAWISTDFDHWIQEGVESFALPYAEGPRRDEVHLGVGAASFGNVLVGLYCIWHNDADFANISGDFGLVVSNDGIAFREPVKGFPWLTAAESPATPVDGKDYTTVLCQANGIVNVGDETRIYHGRWRNVGWKPGMSEEDYYAEVALATIPRDRWGALGLVDEEKEGSVWSTAVQLPETGCTLALNADGIASMRVEIADEDFNPLPGHSGEHSGRAGDVDGLDREVAWPGEDLLNLAGQTVRFRIHMKKKADASPRLYALYLRALEAGSSVNTLETRTTANGNAFAIIQSATVPAPTLLVCAMDAESTLRNDPYGHTGAVLNPQGWNVIALDLPCHGTEQREGEPAQLAGWRYRVERGENIVTDWRRRVDEVLAHLVETGIAEPNRFVVEGTSRGGYMACQAAAGNPAIRAIAVYSPVTDLRGLSEFDGMADDALTAQLSLVNVAGDLVDRPVWIMIGSQDIRVGTGHAIEFARRIAAVADERVVDAKATLHVMPTKGHSSTNEWHNEAAAWILSLD